MTTRTRSDSRGFTLIELLIVVAIVGIIAAIAIPNLVRARASANEAQAIGDTRTVMSANVAFAASNCGYFAPDIECLTTESGGPICIPNYPAIAPQFLAGDLGRPTPYDKSGYTREYGVDGVAGNVNAAICNPTSVLNYCYISYPSSNGLSGVRSFAGGPAGSIFQDYSGIAIGCPIPAGTATLQ